MVEKVLWALDTKALSEKLGAISVHLDCLILHGAQGSRGIYLSFSASL